MADKLFVIAIGGTGMRCLESFVHLCAIGMFDNEEIEVLTLDTDQANGNKGRVEQLIELYNRIKSNETNNINGGEPNAWGAFRLAKEVWAEDIVSHNELNEFQRGMIFPIGEPNTAYARYFSGRSWLASISTEQIPFCNVTFEPGCRNNWHVHRAAKGGGWMLVGVAGRGWYQEEGKPAVEKFLNVTSAEYSAINDIPPLR